MHFIRNSFSTIITVWVVYLFFVLLGVMCGAVQWGKRSACFKLCMPWFDIWLSALHTCVMVKTGLTSKWLQRSLVLAYYYPTILHWYSQLYATKYVELPALWAVCHHNKGSFSCALRSQSNGEVQSRAPCLSFSTLFSGISGKFSTQKSMTKFR